MKSTNVGFDLIYIQDKITSQVQILVNWERTVNIAKIYLKQNKYLNGYTHMYLITIGFYIQ